MSTIAQSDFDVVHNQIESRLNPPAKVQQGLVDLLSAPPSSAPLYQTLFVTKSASLTYTYNNRSSRLPDRIETEGHAFTPVLFLDSPKLGLSLQPSLTFVYSDGDNGTTLESHSNAIEGKLAAALDVGRYFLPQKTPWSLSLVVNGGYRFTEANIQDSGVETSTDNDNFFVVGGVSLGYVIIKPDAGEVGTLLYTGTPLVRYDDKELQKEESEITSHSSSTTFLFENRLDYVVAEAVTISGFATWIHDLNLRLPEGITDYESWAEVGFQTSMKFLENWKARVGFSHEAFNTNFENSKATVTVWYFF